MQTKAIHRVSSHTRKTPVTSIYDSKNDIDDKSEFFTIYESNNTKYTLKKPIVASISKVGNEYKIEYPSLELYAFNEDKDEATEEFLDDFFDLCDNILYVNDSDLGQYPKKWKKLLLTIVEENGKN